MKKLSTILLAGILASLVASVAFAGTPRIDRRQALQHERIARGRECGQLTRGEAARLHLGQRHVRRMEWRAQADGRFTRGERRRIERAQDRQSRMIERLRHNRRHRV
jgi:hypothetical protein